MRSSCLTVVVVALLGASSCVHARGARPTQIHLSLEGPASTSVTVTWRSTSPRGEVRFSAVDAPKTLTAQHAASRPTAPSRPKAHAVAAQSRRYKRSYLHHARLQGLRPGTRYRYQAGGGKHWSPWYRFKTAPSPTASAGRKVRFAVFGDTRSNERIRREVLQALARRKPELLLHTGDIVADGRQQFRWNSFFRAIEPLAAHAPLMPAIGNHERRAPEYYAQFALPRHGAPTKSYAPEAFYSFDYGPLHVVAVSTEPVGPDGGVQARWLAWDLAKARANSATPWIIVIGHRAPYSAARHGDHLPAQRAWTQLFEQYGVALTFWGHDHGYQRSKALRAGKVVAKGGVTYVVTAGAGAPLYEIHGNARMAVGRKAHHFVEVDATPNALQLRAIDSDGKVFDRLTLRQPAKLR